MDRHLYAWKADGVAARRLPRPGGRSREGHRRSTRRPTLVTFGRHRRRPQPGRDRRHARHREHRGRRGLAARDPDRHQRGVPDQPGQRRGGRGTLQRAARSTAPPSRRSSRWAGPSTSTWPTPTAGSTPCTPTARPHAGGPFVEGWPVKLGLLMSELLPVVGEGVNGSPVVAPLTCPVGRRGRQGGRDARSGPGLRAQSRRHLLPAPAGREEHLAAIRRARRAGPGRHPLPRRGPAGLRHGGGSHHLRGAGGGGDPGARPGGQRVSGRRRRHRGLEPGDRPVPAQLPAPRSTTCPSSPARPSATWAGCRARRSWPARPAWTFRRSAPPGFPRATAGRDCTATGW